MTILRRPGEASGLRREANLIPRIERFNASLFANSYVSMIVMANRVLLTLGLGLSMAWIGLVGYALVKLAQSFL